LKPLLLLDSSSILSNGGLYRTFERIVRMIVVERMPSFVAKTQLLRIKSKYKMDEIVWDPKSHEKRRAELGKGEAATAIAATRSMAPITG